MRIGDDNLFEIGCRASPPHSPKMSCPNIYRCRIAECGQLQHDLDTISRTSYCEGILVLRYWRWLPRSAGRRGGPGRVHGRVWAICRTTYLEWTWTGARGGFATETRRVPPRNIAQVQSAEERRSAGLIVRTVETVTV